MLISFPLSLYQLYLLLLYKLVPAYRVPTSLLALAVSSDVPSLQCTGCQLSGSHLSNQLASSLLHTCYLPAVASDSAWWLHFFSNIVVLSLEIFECLSEHHSSILLHSLSSWNPLLWRSHGSFYYLLVTFPKTVIDWSSLSITLLANLHYSPSVNLSHLATIFSHI